MGSAQSALMSSPAPRLRLPPAYFLLNGVTKYEMPRRRTVAGLQDVAQRRKPGTSPTFIIETEPGNGTENRRSVWVEGEPTNVLHRLQRGVLQENQLATGTTILASVMSAAPAT